MRRARNEVFYRESNEALARASRQSISDRFDCICECDRIGCVERVDVTRTEYEAVRAHGDRFVLVPGHEDDEIEVVIERNRRYVVVEKLGLARAIAEATDPR